MDYATGLKKDVAETKFLIHDLRVESFFNEVIHYHVTVDTDLEIYGVDQAQALHGADLEELKAKARDLRTSFQAYSDAVRNFSPDKTVLAAGKRYLQAVWDECELILHPLWGRTDQVLSFLPPESRSVRSRSHYRNCLRWICGVYYRLEHFRNEQEGRDVHEVFEVADDLQDFTRNVVYGYVVEKSSARVELRLDLEPAVLGGNRHRFRRMYFNLVMNAVDAMLGRKVGVIHVSSRVEGDRVVLRVNDNGSGMTPEKLQQLLADRETLDGELHSLGFVFVRQTVAQFGGLLEIGSEPGKGTTVTIRLPFLSDAVPPPRQPSRCEKYALPEEDDRALAGRRPREAGAHAEATSPSGRDGSWGETILEDYRRSDSPHPGSIFAIAVTEDDRVDYFTHRPYERLWGITHEDLAPTFFQATVRGRLEEDDEKRPVLILKAPQNVREYFDFKELPEEQRSAEAYNRMVHDEYIRVARKLIASGMDPGIGVLLTDIPKLFPGCAALLEKEPVELQVLADQKLTGE